MGRLLGPALMAVRLPVEAVDILAGNILAVDVDILAVDILAVLPIEALNQRSQSLVLLLVLHRLAVHSWRRTYFQEQGSLHRVYKM